MMAVNMVLVLLAAMIHWLVACGLVKVGIWLVWTERGHT